MEMATKKRGNCLLTPLKRSDYRHYLNNRKSTNYHSSLAERRRQAHDIGETISANIRTEPEKNKGKELTIKLPGAVAQMNNRGTVASAQIAGRHPK